jgi:hypothetical protein
MTTLDTYVSRPYNALKVAALGFVGLAMSYLPGNAQAAPPGWACQEVPGKVREVVEFGTQDMQPNPYGLEMIGSNYIVVSTSPSPTNYRGFLISSDGVTTSDLIPGNESNNMVIVKGENIMSTGETDRLYSIINGGIAPPFNPIFETNLVSDPAFNINYSGADFGLYGGDRILVAGTWDDRSKSMLVIDRNHVTGSNPELLQFDTAYDNITLLSNVPLPTLGNVSGIAMRPYDGKLFLVDKETDSLISADLQYDPNDVITGLSNVQSVPIIDMFTQGTGLRLDSPAGLAYNTDISQLVLVDQGASNGFAGELHIIDDGRLSATDFNNDGTVDMLDVTEFVQLLQGPEIPYLDPADRNIDVDKDGDVDMHDFAALQYEFTGPCP